MQNRSYAKVTVKIGSARSGCMTHNDPMPVEDGDMLDAFPDLKAALIQSGLQMTQERLVALGLVIEFSASMEHSLARVFCALVDSPWAVILAAGRTAEWLIENCKALVTHRPDLTGEVSDRLLAALTK